MYKLDFLLLWEDATRSGKRLSMLLYAHWHPKPGSWSMLHNCHLLGPSTLPLSTYKSQDQNIKSVHGCLLLGEATRPCTSLGMRLVWCHKTFLLHVYHLGEDAVRPSSWYGYITAVVWGWWMHQATLWYCVITIPSSGVWNILLFSLLWQHCPYGCIWDYFSIEAVICYQLESGN